MLVEFSEQEWSALEERFKTSKNRIVDFNFGIEYSADTDQFVLWSNGSGSVPEKRLQDAITQAVAGIFDQQMGKEE